jgi:hypothetical protein
MKKLTKSTLQDQMEKLRPSKGQKTKEATPAAKPDYFKKLKSKLGI